MSMIIRYAKLNDYDQMSKIFKQVDELHSDFHPEIFNQLEFDARTIDYIDSIIKDSKSRLIVAEENGKIIGLAKSDIVSSPDVSLFVKRDYIDISTIVVDEQYRGRGVGQKLLDRIYEWAKEVNISEVELSVFSFNETAVKFYENNGFKEVRKKMSKKIGII